MKYLRRLSCVLLVAVILSVTFSITAVAESPQNYRFTVKYLGASSRGTFLPLQEQSYTSSDDFTKLHSGLSHYFDSSSYISMNVYVDNADGTIIAKKGETFDFQFNDFFAYMDIDGDSELTIFRKFDTITMKLYHPDGTYTTVTDGINFVFNSSNNRFNVTGTVEAEKDIKQIMFDFYYKPNNRTGIYGQYSFSFCLGQFPPSFSIDKPTKTEGLLGGLIEWVKNIFNSITDGFANLGNGISNIFNSIIELPSKLWQLISDGLKDLFVPDEQFMTDYSDEWDFLLGQRFGALYEVADIIRDFVSDIQYSDTTNTISMPLVDLTSAGIPFSFGGYEVQIVPSGFETLVNVCKKILSAICTFMFINSLRKRYDEVMGVEQ